MATQLKPACPRAASAVRPRPVWAPQSRARLSSAPFSCASAPADPRLCRTLRCGARPRQRRHRHLWRHRTPLAPLNPPTSLEANPTRAAPEPPTRGKPRAAQRPTRWPRFPTDHLDQCRRR
eukprot:63797-Prymnesium_polylepis.1